MNDQTNKILTKNSLNVDHNRFRLYYRLWPWLPTTYKKPITPRKESKLVWVTIIIIIRALISWEILCTRIFIKACINQNCVTRYLKCDESSVLEIKSKARFRRFLDFWCKISLIEFSKRWTSIYSGNIKPFANKNYVTRFVISTQNVESSATCSNFLRFKITSADNF